MSVKLIQEGSEYRVTLELVFNNPLQATLCAIAMSEIDQKHAAEQQDVPQPSGTIRQNCFVKGDA